MSKKIATLILFAITHLTGYSQATDYEVKQESLDDFAAESERFARGEAKSGEEYFFGVLADVIEADVLFQKIQFLDDANSPLLDFIETLDSCNAHIKNGRSSLELYKTESWPLRSELHDLTLKWYSRLEVLTTKFLPSLLEPLSRADETWTDAEFDYYETYLLEYDNYLEVDQEWVDFQYVFCEANGFQLSDETIDVDALIESEYEEFDGITDEELELMEIENKIQMKASIEKFKNGGALTAGEYHQGLTANFSVMDSYFDEILRTEGSSKTTAAISELIGEAKQKLESFSVDLKKYKKRDWLLHKEFYEISVTKAKTLAELLDELKGMATQLSRNNSEWSDEEQESFDAFVSNVMEFGEIYNEWERLESKFVLVNDITYD